MSQASDPTFYLHPRNSLTGAETSLHDQRRLLSAQSESWRTDGFSADGSRSTLQNREESICESVGGNVTRHVEKSAQQVREHQKRGKGFVKEPKRTRHLKDRKTGGDMEDIVERNKKTLGKRTPHSGSYMLTHALKREMPYTVEKVHVVPEETLHPAGQEDDCDSTHTLQQDTQQMQMSSRAETEVRLQSNGKEEQHQELPRSSLSQFPSTIHRKVHIYTPSRLLLPPKQTRRDAIINLESYCDYSSRNSVPDLVLCSEYQHFHQKEFPQKSRNWRQPQNQGRRRALEMERQHQRWNPNHETRTAQHAVTPVTPSSDSMSSFTVLPPIGDVMKGSGDDDDAQSAAQPTQRCSSEGYLVRMEKQRQVHAASKQRAEKMERQTLRLKGIDDQEKRMRTIPVTAAKGSDGKDQNNPRTKALEYAKNIVKPTGQPAHRQTELTERCNRQREHALHQDGLDTSLFRTLEYLVKRHEDDNTAIADKLRSCL